MHKRPSGRNTLTGGDPDTGQDRKRLLPELEIDLARVQAAVNRLRLAQSAAMTSRADATALS